MFGTLFTVLVVLASLGYMGKDLIGRARARGWIRILPSGICMAIIMIINQVWGGRIMAAAYSDATLFLNYTTYNSVKGFGELIHGIWSHGINIGHDVMTALHPLLAAMVILWFAFLLAKMLERLTKRIAGNLIACTIIAVVTGVAAGLLASVGATAIIGLVLLALGFRIFV